MTVQHFDFQQNVEASDCLDAVAPLRDAGFALHWLHAREKRPIASAWSEAPFMSAEELRSTHLPGYNVGVRLGEPSMLGDGYLHVLDLDIRVDDLKDEAWAALAELFPGRDLTDLPCVQSGSGGESRHLYLITDKPFRSKRLWVSDGKHRGSDGKWHFDAEIELFGTGKQVVLPPSIHPSGKPYVWLREFDVALLDLGIGPFVPSSAIERLAVAEHAIYEFETREPLTFGAGQLERALSDIPVSELHYDDWIRLGQALHHQFGGSQEGFDLWLEHTKRSSKFTGDKQVREMRRTKWKSFGRYRGKPVTMATIVEWAKDARLDMLRDAFDEEDDLAGSEQEIGPKPSISAGLSPPAAAEEITDDIDAIGGDAPAAVDYDDILGGDDEDDDEDELDEIGGSRPVKGQSRAVSGDWVSLLDIGEKGEIRSTLHNVELIVANDPRLVGLPQLNEFTQETVQRTPPGRRAQPAQRRQASAPARRKGVECPRRTQRRAVVR